MREACSRVRPAAGARMMGAQGLQLAAAVGVLQGLVMPGHLKRGSRLVVQHSEAIHFSVVTRAEEAGAGIWRVLAVAVVGRPTGEVELKMAAEAEVWALMMPEEAAAEVPVLLGWAVRLRGSCAQPAEVLASCQGVEVVVLSWMPMTLASVRRLVSCATRLSKGEKAGPALLGRELRERLRRVAWEPRMWAPWELTMTCSWPPNQTCMRNYARHQCQRRRASSTWACLRQTSLQAAAPRPCLPPPSRYLGFLDRCCCAVGYPPGQGAPGPGRAEHHLREDRRLLTSCP